MAQQRRAEERRKNEFRKKLSKILVIGIPSLAVLALVIVLIVDGVTNKVTNPHFKWGFDFNPSGIVPGFRQRRSFAVPFLLVAF